MAEILIRAGCFVAIILLGFFLRKIGLFQYSDFGVLSKIVIKITLPASIIASFAKMELDWALLSLALLAFASGVVHMTLAWLLNRKKEKERLAFDLINLTGYNIGCFTLPFVQTFIGPAGVIAVSLFDIGNAPIGLGGTCGMAAAVKDGTGFSLKRVGRSLVTSVPLICYILMTALRLMHITLPDPVISLAEIIGSANAFLAMLMIGVGFRLEADRSQIGRIVRHLVIRYAVAALLALLCWFVLPFDVSVRQVLLLLVFSPIGSTAPAFTAEVKGDVGLASAINSLTIVISIIIMVTLMITMF